MLPHKENMRASGSRHPGPVISCLEITSPDRIGDYQHPGPDLPLLAMHISGSTSCSDYQYPGSALPLLAMHISGGTSYSGYQHPAPVITLLMTLNCLFQVSSV